MAYIVYLLINTSNHYTYLGITNHPQQRLRQHNQELKGGAKYTRMHQNHGIWKYVLQIKHLTKHEALSLERTAKNLRKKSIGKTPLARRLHVLLPLLHQYPHCELVMFP